MRSWGAVYHNSIAWVARSCTNCWLCRFGVGLAKQWVRWAWATEINLVRRKESASEKSYALSVRNKDFARCWTTCQAISTYGWSWSDRAKGLDFFHSVFPYKESVWSQHILERLIFVLHMLTEHHSWACKPRQLFPAQTNVFSPRVLFCLDVNIMWWQVGS